MARWFVNQRLAILVFVCLSQACYAGEHALKTNPFAKPVEIQERANAPSSSIQEVSVPFVLRGTMVAGQQSLANISGVIVSLGEEINGYKLVGVQQREVVLLKDTDRRVLTVYDVKEGGQ